MILYHGSYNNFDKFKISPELARHDVQTVLPEGLGVYMSQNLNIVKSYGDIVYTVEVEEIYDFTKISSIYKIITEFLSFYDTNKILKRVLKSNETKVTIDSIKKGKISIIKLIKELLDMHDEHIHSLDIRFDIYEYQDFLNENWKKYLEKKVIKYKSNDLGLVYIAKNENLIKIISKEKI